MDIKKLFKIVWLFIFSITHPATIGLLIFCLGEKLDVTFPGSTNITFINAKKYFFYAILFTIIWYTALYFIAFITKNKFSDLLDYNLGTKYYPIYTTLFITNILWLLISFHFLIALLYQCFFINFPNRLLLSMDSIIFIIFILSLSYVIRIQPLYIFFAIYGYITLKTFYTGMEGNVFGFLFAMPFLFFLMQSCVLFIKQSWMLITKQF